MAFLDNSGDIIVDAVLTDTGRKRLAAGDGSFRVVKFALGDDEIDYGLYRNSNSTEGRHASGSAYYDLNILQTPVLEAFTNNTSILNSRLISYTRSDLLYLPVTKVNTKLSPTIDMYSNGLYASASVPVGGYIITADAATSNPSTLQTGGASNESPLVLAAQAGVIRGAGSSIVASENITLDQGLDTSELSVAMLATGDPLRETQYLIEMDNRLGQVMGMDGTTVGLGMKADVHRGSLNPYFHHTCAVLPLRRGSIRPRYTHFSPQGSTCNPDPYSAQSCWVDYQALRSPAGLY